MLSQIRIASNKNSQDHSLPTTKTTRSHTMVVYIPTHEERIQVAISAANRGIQIRKMEVIFSTVATFEDIWSTHEFEEQIKDESEDDEIESMELSVAFIQWVYQAAAIARAKFGHYECETTAHEEEINNHDDLSVASTDSSFSASLLTRKIEEVVLKNRRFSQWQRHLLPDDNSHIDCTTGDCEFVGLEIAITTANFEKDEKSNAQEEKHDGSISEETVPFTTMAQQAAEAAIDRYWRLVNVQKGIGPLIVRQRCFCGVCVLIASSSNVTGSTIPGQGRTTQVCKPTSSLKMVTRTKQTSESPVPSSSSTECSTKSASGSFVEYYDNEKHMISFEGL